MLSITRDEAPAYLADTPFYRSLEDGDTFEVPKHCYKLDTVLNTKDDARELISTTRYWGKEGVSKELVSYALDKGYDHCRSLLEDAQSDLRYLKVVSSILESPSKDSMNIAMRSGEVAIVQCLYERGYSWGPTSMEYAAAKGHLECMKYAHENGCAWTEGTFIEAAGFGHLQCLQYAIDNGCPREFNTFMDADRSRANAGAVKSFSSFKTCGACAYAAHNGQLQMLQHLRVNGLALWNRYTLAAAAGAGHLDCLKYAHANGCEVDGSVTVLAAQYRHFDCLEYALAQGCPYSSWTIYQMFMQDHPDTGKLLRADGDMWKTALYTVQLILLVQGAVAFNVLSLSLALILIAVVLCVLYGLLVALWYICALLYFCIAVAVMALLRTFFEEAV